MTELALEISTAKANGCDSAIHDGFGDCTCGECELPLAADEGGGDCTCVDCELWRAALLQSDECELPLAADDDCLGGGDCTCGECELPHVLWV